MPAGSTVTLASLIKRLFPDGIAFPAYQKSRLVSMCPKNTNFGGRGMEIIVDVAPTTAGSANFADALANKNPSQNVNFFLVHRREYQLYSLTGDVIARSMGDKNAIVAAFKHEFEKAMYAFGRATAARAWGNGGGSLGRISAASNVALTTITLANPADIVRFEVGMRVQTSSDDGTPLAPAGLRGGGATLTINTVDRATGILTASAAWNTIVATVATDFIFRAGDYSVAMTGLPGWCPVVAPLAGDSFFGVNRSLLDPARASGNRLAGGGAPMEETLVDASSLAHLAGQSPSTCFINPIDYGNLVKELGAKVVYTDIKNTAGLGFKALQVMGNSGPIDVVSETDVPFGFFWLTDVSQFKQMSAGEFPMVLDEDGVGKLLREATGDSYEGRLGAYGNFAHFNPGSSVIGTW